MTTSDEVKITHNEEQTEQTIANPSSDNQDESSSDKDDVSSIPVHDTIPLKDESSPEHEQHVSFSQSNLVTIGCAAERDDDDVDRDDIAGSCRSLGFGSIGVQLDTNTRSKTFKDDPSDNPPKWGWVVVIAAWIVMIPVAGALTSYGMIVSSITEEFNATKLEAGWIGSLVFGFTVGSCPLSSALITVYGARKLALGGVFGGTISLLITSFTPNLYLMFLTYSTMVGLSANFVYNSAMTLTGMYFPNKHQAMATCLASAGVSFGTLLINPLASTLVEDYGWRWTIRIMAALVFVIGICCVATFRPVNRYQRNKRGKVSENGEKLIENGDVDEEEKQEPPTESRMSLAAQEIKKQVLNKGAWDFSVCYSPSCHLWMFGTFLWAVSFLFPFIFLIDYLETIGIPKESGAFVLTAYGIAEFGGRLICALGAGRIPCSLAYVYAGAAAFAGAATLLVPLGTSLPVMYSYAIAAGIAAGTLNALMFVTTMQLFGNDRGTAVWGYINVMLAIGMIAGPVMAGGIYDATDSYVTAFYVGGGLFIFCAVIMFLIPLSKQFEKRRLATSYQENNNHHVEKTSHSSIVKHDVLLKQAQRNSAKKSSKWNTDVHKHLEALDAIEDEIRREGADQQMYLIPNDQDKTEQNNGKSSHCA